MKKEHKNFLNNEDLKELSALPNVSIGSHSKSHSNLTRLNENEIIELSQKVTIKFINNSDLFTNFEDEVLLNMNNCQNYIPIYTKFFKFIVNL